MQDQPTEGRQNLKTNTPWEPIVGYSRAVRMGTWISVSGTTATDHEGKLISTDSAYQQTVQVIKNIETALKQLGASLHDVIRTRIYVINIDDWKQIAKAHSESFDLIRPTTTMIEVKRFISPQILVEIEADALTRS